MLNRILALGACLAVAAFVGTAVADAGTPSGPIGD
jgi:hypothetical protein